MESLIDRRCAGCVRDCTNELYYKCAQSDYPFYKCKSKYKAYGFYGTPEPIVAKINKFFVENPQAEVLSITKLDGFEEYYPGVMVVVKEN